MYLGRYIGRNIDYESKTVTFYGTGGATMEFDLTKNMEETAEQLLLFLQGYSYKKYISNIATEIVSFYSPTVSSAYGLLREAEQKAFYRERKEILLEARAYFKQIEKDDSVDITIHVPVNGSTVREVITPRLMIRISDNRTILHNRTIYANECQNHYNVVDTADFSHIPDNVLFDDSHKLILCGFKNFADNWEMIKSEIEKELNKEEEEEYSKE